MLDADRERFKLWPSSYDCKLYQDWTGRSADSLVPRRRSRWQPAVQDRAALPKRLKAVLRNVAVASKGDVLQNRGKSQGDIAGRTNAHFWKRV